LALELPGGITLYFARHGETEANVEKRFSGFKDTPLTPRGFAQAATAGHILKRELGAAAGFAFVSSPLTRARVTMRVAREAMGLPPDGFATDNRLKEINLGVWDQLTDEEARALSPVLFEQRGNDKWHVRVPGGENYAEVAARLTDWVHELKQDTVAVSHGATIRILRGLLAGMDWRGMNALDEPQGVVFRAKGSEVALLEPSAELR
jgi:probable phosphoglycerate mutase